MTKAQQPETTPSSHSDQEVPKIKLGLQEKYEQEKNNIAPDKEPLNPDSIKPVVDELPEPSGWRILVLPFTPKEKTKGGLLIAQEALDRLAYKDKDKFEQPWCKKGDWVIFARYAGSRLPIEGGEIRILNDDEVLGTVKDPESVLHYI